MYASFTATGLPDRDPLDLSMLSCFVVALSLILACLAPVFVTHFLLTYRAFTTALEILAYIRQRYGISNPREAFPLCFFSFPFHYRKRGLSISREMIPGSPTSSECQCVLMVDVIFVFTVQVGQCRCRGTGALTVRIYIYRLDGVVFVSKCLVGSPAARSHALSYTSPLSPYF